MQILRSYAMQYKIVVSAFDESELKLKVEYWGFGGILRKRGCFRSVTCRTNYVSLFYALYRQLSHTHNNDHGFLSPLQTSRERNAKS